MRRKTGYIYDLPDWPLFRWDSAALAVQLGAVRHRQGRLLGQMGSLGFDFRKKATLESLTDEAIKTSEIEGEILDRAQVRSSLARRLGMPTGAVIPVDRRAEAIATVVLDATQRFDQPLTVQRLFDWHAALFASPAKGPNPITIGAWRDDRLGPMQVVSGPIGRERVHFQAPPAARVPIEVHKFLDWFESNSATIDPVLKAAVAHIWFVTIHPFDDGNGRIGRAIADLALARSEGTSQRFYSMSSSLRTERGAYYQTLESTQKGDLDITERLAWFLAVFDQALAKAETALAATIRKSRFWEKANATPLNARQKMMLNRLLDGFDGKLTSSKWALIAKCSQDTALRDIDGLVRIGFLTRAAAGRSTSYVLVEEKTP